MAENTKYGMFIGIVLAVVIALSLVSTVYDTIDDVNTTGWSAITGGTGAIAIMELSLLIFVASIVIYLIKQALA